MRTIWYTLVALHLVLMSMACAGNSPTAPAPTPTPTPTPLPSALIQNAQDTVTGIVQGDGTFAISPTAVNNGTGCAGSVTGATDFNNTAGFLKTITWTMPAGAVIHPNERFNYLLCCLTQTEAFSEGIRYFTRFQYQTVACQ